MKRKLEESTKTKDDDKNDNIEDPDLEFVLRDVPPKNKRIKGVSYLLKNEVRVWNGSVWHCEHDRTKCLCIYCSPDKIIVCHLCPYRTTSSQRMIVHKRTHSGDKPFKCQVNDCAYSATQEQQLIIHALTHTGQLKVI